MNYKINQLITLKGTAQFLLGRLLNKQLFEFTTPNKPLQYTPLFGSLLLRLHSSLIRFTFCPQQWLLFFMWATQTKMLSKHLLLQSILVSKLS
ncbi:hypothetical protein L6164_023759 [Bauhinia variegata]|uniref:Uncharacterized protein n=1 Tax=Bauhinia variegata TaxID=167791 RepID=A0ACB9MLD3_BAUVA|nr:hypothetical protein L6164_023759 [Bauhinia variegata]